MKNHSFFISLIIFILLPCLALALENPDELYKKGDFKGAEKAYNELDMNNPRKFEYRYNRGCAAYRNEDWKGAAAAFTSVLKRSEDKDLRFRAAFNLGNALYKMEDYQGARKIFEEALRIKPGDKNARKNLELVLHEIEKKKQQEEDKKQDKKETPQGQEQQNQEGQQDKEGGKQEDRQEGENNEQKSPGENQQQNQQGDGKQSGNEQGQGKQEQTKPDQTRPDNEEMNKNEAGQAPEKQDQEKKEGKSASDRKEGQNTQAEKSEQGNEGSMERPEEKESEPNLTGTLSSAQGTEGQKEDDKAAQAPNSPMLLDRKKAESMLDNVNENPSRMLLYKSSGSEQGKEKKAW